MKGRGLLLALAAAAICVAWNQPLVYPLKLLVVLFHECGHAAAALLTGGRLLEIVVRPDQGGVTTTTGGWRLLVLNGGYLGSLLSGVVLMATAKRPRAGRVMAALLGVLVGATAWLWVPLWSFAFVFSVAVAVGLLLLAWLRGALAAGVLRFVGLFSVLYALVDIREDVFGAPAGAVTDATMLAHLTGVPAFAWGAAWLAVGLLVLWTLRRLLV